MENKEFVIAAYVDNEAGVVTRVSSMFTRRRFNIHSFTGGETEYPEYSRITISMEGDEYVREQLIHQLEKIVAVKKVGALEKEPIKRELMLIKVVNDSATRGEIMAAVDVYRANVVDYSAEGLCIEVTGSPSKIDAFVKLMKPFGILEMCRTGIVALDRGGKTIFTE